MRILVTGGTGSLGLALVSRLIHDPLIERVCVLSRNEHKVREMADRYPDAQALRPFVGDIRDRQRLGHAFRNIDCVVHAAALKRVDAVVNESRELARTNVEGTLNVLEAALESGVRKVLFISSDKACQATNCYGMTKGLAECHTVGFNAYAMPRGMACSAVRYGNVYASTGSVVHIWRKAMAHREKLPITDPTMTRFHLTLPEAVDFVLSSIHRMHGGEIYVPPLPAYRLHDLASAVLKYGKVSDWEQWHRHVKVTGLRPGGEKLHESLLSEEEPLRTLFDRDRFVVTPAHRTWSANPYTGEPVDKHLMLRSDQPVRWMTIEELEKLVSET